MVSPLPKTLAYNSYEDLPKECEHGKPITGSKFVYQACGISLTTVLYCCNPDCNRLVRRSPEDQPGG